MKYLILIILLISFINLQANAILWDDDVIVHPEFTVAFLTDHKVQRYAEMSDYFPKVTFDLSKFKERHILSFKKEDGVFFNLLAVTVSKSYELNKVLLSFQESDNIIWAQRVGGNKKQIDPREYEPESDPLYEQQAHHQIMKNPAAWDISQGEGVIVAITDDGTNLKHEDLRDGIWQNTNEIPNNNIDDDRNGFIDDINGWNFIHLNNINHERRLGHGTHVSGIVGARMNNGIGLVGTAPESTLMPLKFYESFDSPRRWSSLLILESYVYAVDNGARIITTSYNIDPFIRDDIYHLALDYADKNEVLVFNSAGNSGMDNPTRASIDRVILVGNTQTKRSKVDLVSRGSNYGIGIDLMAPGEDIYSTAVSGEYTYKSGTSMAAPNAAAVAALIWSKNPDWNHYQVAAKLFQGCDDIEKINQTKFKFKVGAGRVNSFNSLVNNNLGPEIRRIIMADNIRIKIQMNSVFNKESFVPESFKLANLNTGEIIPLKMMKEYFYGTNQIEFKYGKALKKGNYEFRALSHKLVDPFGNPLRNGDFVHTFRIN